MLTLGSEVLRDPALAATREWLVADGLGGYASSTVIGLNTRRQHGLLVVATRPPVGRMVLLSRVEEAVLVGDSRLELGTNAYPGGLHPRGYETALSFTLDPLPTLTWEVGAGRLSRTVARIHGLPATLLAYQYTGSQPVKLEVRPLLAYRELHALQRENEAIDRVVRMAGDDVALHPYPNCLPLHLRVPGGTWTTDGFWYHRFEYEHDRQEGHDFSEDLFSHGFFQVSLTPGVPAYLLAWAGPVPDVDPDALLRSAKRRIRALGEVTDGLLGLLRRAADSFIVRRGSSRTIMAAYPSGTDRGRDVMAALPGLCLATGRHEDARAVLTDFAAQVEGGALPHPFPEDGGTPRYESVDAALWMISAVDRYREATGDVEFVRSRMQGVVLAVLEAYRAGTRHGFGMGADALITHEAAYPLTWMVSRSDGRMSRAGQAVEVQALWFNALLVGAELAREAGQSVRAGEWAGLAARARESFLRSFWSETRGYLADVVAGGTPDLTLRPSQLYAIGLHHSLLPRDKAHRALEAVKRLLTPVGLRTLAPTEARTRGEEEDGNAWPHLAGIYFDALIRVHGEEAKAEAWRWLDKFPEHLTEGALGMVPERFEAEPSHRPLGAPAWAWSVGELLRLTARLGRRPAHRIPFRNP